MNRQIILTAEPYECMARLDLEPGHTVLVPNQEAARTLNIPYASLDRLCRKVLAGNGLGIASPLVAHRLLKTAVTTVLDPADPTAKTRSLTLTIRQILLTGATDEMLQAMENPRLQKLVAVTSLYRSLLKEQHLLDPGDMFWIASRLPVSRQPVVLYGYPKVGMDMLHFIDALCDSNSTILLPYLAAPALEGNKAAADWLSGRGWQVRYDETSGNTPSYYPCARYLGLNPEPAEVSAYAYPNIHAEVRGTLTQVKELLEEDAICDDIALVSRDCELYDPVVGAIAKEYGLSVRLSHDIPMRNTQLGHWFSLWREMLLNNFPFEVTATFLGHPFNGKLDAESWQAARLNHPAGLNAWLGVIGAQGKLLKRLAWSGSASRSEWCNRLKRLLHDNQVFTRVNAWPREINALRTLQEILSIVSQPEAEVISCRHFLDEIDEALDTVSSSVGEGYSGVRLLTPLALYGARYRHVFVLGAAEGCLPAPVENNPVFDFHDRQILRRQGQLAMDGALEMAREEELSIVMLLQAAASRLTISYPRLMDNREKQPGSLFERLGIEPVAGETNTLASLEEFRKAVLQQETDPDDGVLAAARCAWAIETQRLQNERYDEYDGITGIPVDASDLTMSPSQLAALGRCPFQWFARYALYLKEPEEALDEMGGASLGRFYHRVLELAAAKVREQVTGESFDWQQAILERLEACVDQAARELRISAYPLWPARRLRYLQTLRLAVQAPDFIQPGAKILALEQDFEEVEWHGFRMKGCIDRIDRLPEGLFLVDYKAGSSITRVKDADNKLQQDVQLPIYAAAARQLFPGEDIAGAKYFSIHAAKNIGTSRNKPASEDSLQAVAERLHGYLRRGAFPVEPDAESKACEYCEYPALCRPGIRLQLKEAIHVPD